MKKIIFAFFGMLFSTGLFAQDGKMMKDHVTMKDGKMWVMKDGKTMAMDKDVTMSNGTTVSLSGKVTTADGKSWMLKNDDLVTMDGMMATEDMTKKDKPKTNQ